LRPVISNNNNTGCLAASACAGWNTIHYSIALQQSMLERTKLQITITGTATFEAVVDPGTRMLFLFARCRYMSILGILLLSN